MRVSPLLFVLLLSGLCNWPLRVSAEQQQQTPSETQPDAEILEFLALFEQQDSDYVDEMLDEQLPKSKAKENTGKKDEK